MIRKTTLILAMLLAVSLLLAPFHAKADEESEYTYEQIAGDYGEYMLGSGKALTDGEIRQTDQKDISGLS